MNYSFDVEIDGGDVIVGIRVTSATRGYAPSWYEPGSDDEIEYDIVYVCMGDENGDTIVLSGDEAVDWVNDTGRLEDVDIAVYEQMDRSDDE